jgi:hypothetical protein
MRTRFPEVVDRLNKLVVEDLGNKALVSAMNKVMARARTAMVKAIVAIYAIKASDVREQITVDKARINRRGVKAVATLQAFGRRKGHRSRNVMLFSALQVFGRYTKRVRINTGRGWITRDVPIGGGVTVQIKRGAGRKLIKGAFIGNEGRTVFQRRPGSGRKIFAVETIDVPQMFNTRTINRQVIKVIEDRFPNIFAHEAEWFLSRYNQAK